MPTKILATIFGGWSDANNPQHSAYDEKLIIDNKIMACALPAHFHGVRPKVKVTGLKTGVSVVVSIEDIGPWNTHDPYWETNSRPQAESGRDKFGRHTNHAGIDLSPAAAKALDINGSGLVNWEFVNEENT
jgi:hypothetical protein